MQLATGKSQLDVVKYLADERDLAIYAINGEGCTALSRYRKTDYRSDIPLSLGSGFVFLARVGIIINIRRSPFASCRDSVSTQCNTWSS